MRKLLRWTSLLTSIGMFLVLLMGDLVTKTNSGHGCGNDWPLCNGKFIPSYTIHSLIEYSHRAVTGLVSILVVMTFILVWKKVKHRNDAKWVAFSTLFFTVVQALMGAAAVMWPQSPPVLALHFGFSILAFASTLLVVFIIWRDNGQAEQATFHIRVTPGFRYLVWFITIYTYGVVYLGAFVKHTHSSGGCIGWPLCNGKWIPNLTGATEIVFIHRVAAAILFFLIVWMYMVTIRKYASERILKQVAMWTVILVSLQVLSGAFVTLTITNSEWYLVSGMIHTLWVTILFGLLCYLCYLVYKKKK